MSDKWILRYFRLSAFTERNALEGYFISSVKELFLGRIKFA